MRNPAKNLPEKMTLPLAKRILPAAFTDIQLNPRQFKFVAAYCSNGFNATQAAIQAGYSPKQRKNVSALTSDFLKNPNIVKAIKTFIDMVIQPYRDRLEYEVMDIYYRRATYQLSTFVESDGTLKDLDEIPREWLCCVDGIARDVKIIGGTRIELLEYKLPNRDVALQQLCRMATGNVEESPELPEEVRKRLQAIKANVMGSDLKTKTTKVSIEVTETQPRTKTNGKMRRVEEEGES